MKVFDVERVELNREEVRRLLKSSEIAGICESLARGKASELGAGYGVRTFVAQTRFVARVEPQTKKAREDNLDNNSLLKAFGGDVE